MIPTYEILLPSLLFIYLIGLAITYEFKRKRKVK